MTGSTYKYLLKAGLPALFFVSALVLDTPKSVSHELDKTEIQKIVREYLVEHPEILNEMQRVLQDREAAELAANQLEVIEREHEKIYSSPLQIEFGNPDAKITVVEFFDYNCGFCQRAMADMMNLLESGMDIRFVLKEFPVLGNESLEAHRVSLALTKLMPDKVADFHLQLLSLEGLKDGNRAMDLAVSMGADEAELTKAMEQPEILDAIREVYEIADGLGINGTPSYIVGNEVVFGAVGYDELVGHINELQ